MRTCSIRSILDDECSGPAPSRLSDVSDQSWRARITARSCMTHPWGRRSTIPLCFNHLANAVVSEMSTIAQNRKLPTLSRRDKRVDDDLSARLSVFFRSLSLVLLTCAPLKKSPNCIEAPASARYDVTSRTHAPGLPRWAACPVSPSLARRPRATRRRERDRQDEVSVSFPENGHLAQRAVRELEAALAVQREVERDDDALRLLVHKPRVPMSFHLSSVKHGASS